MTQVDCAGFQTLYPALHGHSRLSGNRILASLDSLHVHGDVARNSEAEFAGTAGDGSGIGARYQRFGRDAAGVDAGSAEQFSLDDGDLHSGFDQAGGERWSRLPCSDDDGVEVQHFEIYCPAMTSEVRRV